MTAESTPIKGRFHLGDLVGCGGMGDVFTGTDLENGETVAIKQLRLPLGGNSSKTIDRFLREGETLRKLNHPNIVKVIDTVEENDKYYIVMEYVSGGSVADLLQQEHTLSVKRVVSIGLEVSDALSRAHHLHILHRDIKPANILIAVDGTPRLSDFGLVMIGKLPRLTEADSIIGTLNYSSPEVFEGRKVNERSDIWSLGVVLFEMLTGQLPFTADSSFDLIWAIKNQSLPIIENFRQGIPQSLANLIRRMLRKDNSARVESMRQVGVELETVQNELDSADIQSASRESGSTENMDASPMIKVVIADDHAVVRQGLRMFIDLQEDMQVVGEAENGSQAVELFKKLQPDIVLVDLVMPELDGVEATAKIKALSPKARVIILTSFGEDGKIIPAIQAGAQGYLLKDIQPEALVQAVRDAYLGKTQIHPEIAKKLFDIVSGSKQKVN